MLMKGMMGSILTKVVTTIGVRGVSQSFDIIIMERLLLKEKDYEVLQEKRLLAKKRAYHDPLINPPKPSRKNKLKNVGSSVTRKDLTNPKNVLARARATVKAPLAGDATPGMV